MRKKQRYGQYYKKIWDDENHKKLVIFAPNSVHERRFYIDDRKDLITQIRENLGMQTYNTNNYGWESFPNLDVVYPIEELTFNGES